MRVKIGHARLRPQRKRSSMSALRIGGNPSGRGRAGPRAQLVLGLTLGIGALVLAIKVAAWWLTGSQALGSDALESVVNIFTGLFALFSVRVAARPPDASHPYGHGRIEFFSAGLAGALVLLAGAGILREAIPAIWSPEGLRHLDEGLVLAVIATTANAGVGAYLLRRGRQSGSLALAGEGKHLLADAVTTGGIVLGLSLVFLTGWHILDPILACLVAVSIIWSGVTLLEEAGDRLMDRADPRLLEKIAHALETVRRPEWIEVHLLRVWTSGTFLHIDFHLSLPRFWQLDQMHEAQQQLAAALILELGRSGEIMVHPDPCSKELCERCRVDDCPVRESPFAGSYPWTGRRLVLTRAGEEEDPCRKSQEEAIRALGEEGKRNPRGSEVNGGKAS